MSAIEGLREILKYVFYNYFGELVVAIAIILLALTIQSVWRKPTELATRNKVQAPESPPEKLHAEETKAPVEAVMEEVTHHED